MEDPPGFENGFAENHSQSAPNPNLTGHPVNQNGHSLDNNDSDIEPAPPNGRDVESAVTRQHRRLTEMVDNLIENAKTTGAISLDLTNKKLKKIPKALLECTEVQFLYLEGNELTELPDNFFDCLHVLQWLDLRRNYLTRLPSTYIGRHKYLRTLLLEGNELKTLPLELGLISTLTGLNIASNPLDFPPPEVIEKGTSTILAFFREILRAKSEGRVPADIVNGSESPEQYIHVHDCLNTLKLPRIEDLQLDAGHDSSSSEGDWGGGSHSAYIRNKHSHKSSLRQDSKESMYSDLVGPVPQSASLHKPMSYNEFRQIQNDRLERAGVLEKKLEKSGRLEKSGKKKKRITSQDRFPEPPTSDLVQQRYIEERRLAKLKELKEKQDLILQRRKDQEMLKEFRDDGKRLQQAKHRERIIKGGKLDFPEAAEVAPFGVDKNHMKLPTNEERIAFDIKKQHEKLRALSPNSLRKLDDAKAERDQELQERIKSHTHQMQERRRKGKGTPQEEMQAAMKELEVAHQLQSELEARRKGLEYRFTAFTGDVVLGAPRANRNKKS